MRYLVQVGEETVELDVQRAADGSYRVRDPNGREVSVTTLARRGTAHTLSIAGEVLEVQSSEAQVKYRRERFTAHAESERERARSRPAAADALASKEISAPMPGRIVRVSCKIGDAVTKGAPLIVMEAMKMQNELCAKADQLVRAVRVTSGDTVDRGAILIEFE